MNELLRQHVTRVGFNLTLTKTQIAALVDIDLRLADGRSIDEQSKDGSHVYGNHGRHLLSSSVVSQGALIARGLIVHHPPTEQRPGEWIKRSARDYWSITEAGRAVITLLKESGLWQEIAALIPYTEAPDVAATYTAAAQQEHWRAKAEQDAARMAELNSAADQANSRARRAELDKQRAEWALERLRDQVRELMEEVGAKALAGSGGGMP